MVGKSVGDNKFFEQGWIRADKADDDSPLTDALHATVETGVVKALLDLVLQRGRDEDADADESACPPELQKHAAFVLMNASTASEEAAQFILTHGGVDCLGLMLR